MTATDALDVHILAHTHWDREWYLPAGRFRQRLVALIDELLEHAPDRRDPFLLDGQAIVLEDYLVVRPERSAELSTRLRDGALEAGPWYVLADELIPSGEALVRNLLAGRRTLRALRADPPPVLYCPDSFGHPAILPLLAREFGCELIVLWRGYGGARWPNGDVVRWRAPDGTAALLYHLPRAGYEFGSALPTDRSGAAARWERMRAEIAPRAVLGVTLVPNGADHHARQRGLDDAVAMLAEAAAPAMLRRSSLRQFAAAIAERAARAELPEIAGELRDSYGYTWALQGTFGTRAAQKRRNALAERLLVRDAEPWVALASVGRADDASAGDPRPLLHAAWRTLLACHPHDTLCGCSIDDVARAMDARLDDAIAQARGIRQDALERVVGHHAERARQRAHDWVPSVVVRNAAARPRGGIAELTLSATLQHVPVGPGSGAPTAPRRRNPPLAIGDGAVPLQLLDRELRHERVESPRHYPDNDLVVTKRAVAWVPTIAGYGTRSWAVGGSQDEGADGPRPVVATRDAAGTHALDNGTLRVIVDEKGRVTLHHGAVAVENVLALEDIGDAGDLYTPSPVAGTEGTVRFAAARLVDPGPLRGTIELRWNVRSRGIPRARRAITAAARRSGGQIDGRVRLSLDAESPFLRIAVDGENAASDHRLRLRIGTGVRDASVHADAAFGTVPREPVRVPPTEAAVETPPTTAPLHRYVSLFDRTRGATVFSDGLAEYEALEDGTVAITLLRAVGELSRNDLPERPGHAGWPASTPGAQSLGPFEARFALMPHGPRDTHTIDAIERAADDVLLPLTGGILRSALTVPPPTRGIELEGQGLAFSAALPASAGARGEWVVLRCTNLLEHAVDGAWRLPSAIAEASLARLDDTPTSPARWTNDRVTFTASPRAVVTILARLAREAVPSA